MPITLQELRQNAQAAYLKLQAPCHPLYDDENPDNRDANRARLRDQVRRARAKFQDGLLVGELRKIARAWDVDVADVAILCGGR